MFEIQEFFLWRSSVLLPTGSSRFATHINGQKWSPWFCVNQFSTLILCKCVVWYAPQSADWTDNRQSLSYMWHLCAVFAVWTIGPVGSCTFENMTAYTFCTQRSVSLAVKRVFDHRFPGWWIFRCGPLPSQISRTERERLVYQQKVETREIHCCIRYKEQSWRTDSSSAPDSQTSRDIYQHSVNDKSIIIKNWAYIHVAFQTEWYQAPKLGH